MMDDGPVTRMEAARSGSTCRGVFGAGPRGIRRRVVVGLRFCVAGSAALATLAAPAGRSTQVAAQTVADAPPGKPSSGAVPAAAIERGLRWLTQQQQSDGSFGSLSHYGKHVGITGLAGLSFLADGNTPGRGRYGRVVNGCVDFIVTHGSESGLLAAETSHGPMYGHGFATLFLSEVYGMTRRDDVRETLRKAVRLIVTTQNDEGGWRYQPVRHDADISVTVCQMMALRAARNAGLYVDKAVVDRAVAYVRASQNPDGGFRYMSTSGTSAFARSAAGVAALQYAGVYGGETVSKGLEYCRKFVPPSEQSVGHYFYGHYYAAQAMYLAGDVSWSDWWPAIRDELLSKQADEGYWRGQAGQEYGTAMALIILQMPNRLLPIFQK